MTEPRAEWTRRLPAFVLALAVSVAATCANAADLPPEMQADRYLIQAERQIRAGDHAEALATLDKIIALQTDHGLAIPSAFWFKYAQASQDAGRFEQAIESATRYLVEAGQQGQYYMAALEILDASERLLPHPFSVLAEPVGARVQILDIGEPYRPGLPLPSGEYRVEVSADGYGTVVKTVRHEPGAAAHRVVLRPWEGSENFQDCPACPVMVVIPAGRFQMGCLSDRGCAGDEKPVREVVFDQIFALSKYEVTLADWVACVEAGGCNGSGAFADGHTGGSRRPVNVNWNDAQSYLSWLSDETGNSYRLPSEAEWEYAARAGTVTRYHFGNDYADVCQYANVVDLTARTEIQWVTYEATNCRDGHAYSAPVGSFPANAFGLHDMHGNAWEWVEDCWNRSYRGAPSDGSAWVTGNCRRHVVRGGSWLSGPKQVRSANRYNETPGDSHNGFRVARTLKP